MSSKFHVLIVGGGIGGLCLAQGLVKAGVSVAVYERDRCPDARLQGYRLNIEPIGSRALHRCLPLNNWNAFVALAGDPGDSMGVYDEQLRQLTNVPEAGSGCDPVNSHHAVGRAILRRVLLAGLDSAVHFDKQFVEYEQLPTGKVSVKFADGTSATGDLLIGVDGARSRVRRQLLPDAGEIDIPAVGVGGKLPLNPQTISWLPPQMTHSKNMILPKRDFLFTAAFRSRRKSAEIIADATFAANSDLKEVASDAEDDDYILWAYVSHRERSALNSITQGTELQRLIQSRTTNWHPVLRRMIAETEPETIQAFPFSASARVRPWCTTNVTLLGDALHYMPPVGGMGGNAALHGASLLCSAIESAQAGSATLASALREYEAAMIRHGFAAVRATVLYTRLAICRLSIVRFAARGFFRLCGAMPSLQRAVFD